MLKEVHQGIFLDKEDKRKHLLILVLTFLLEPKPLPLVNLKFILRLCSNNNAYLVTSEKLRSLQSIEPKGVFWGVSLYFMICVIEGSLYYRQQE